MEQHIPVVRMRRRSVLPFTGVSKRKRAAFYTQLARFLAAGIGPVRALSTLAGQAGSWRLSRAARDMAGAVQGGATLAEAFARHPNLFPETEVRMLEAGEQTGDQDAVMLRLAQLLDHVANSARQVATGLIYPVGCLVLAFLVLPLFLAYFGFFGGVGAVLRVQGLALAALAAGALVAVVGWRSLSAQSSLRVVLHGALLRLPLLGRLFRRLAMARFAQSFQCLYAAGVRVPEAMARAALACGNAALGRRILRAVPLVRDGMGVSAALAEVRGVPPMGLNFIASGEEAGKLEESLGTFAQYEQEDADVAVARLVRMLPTAAVFLVIAILAYVVVQAWGAYVGRITDLTR